MNNYNKEYFNPPNTIDNSETETLEVSSSIWLNIINNIYPTGSVFITINKKDNPCDMFPGTDWKRIEDVFLWCCSDENELNNKAGYDKIPIECLPQHSHLVKAGTVSGKWSNCGKSRIIVQTDISGNDTVFKYDNDNNQTKYMPPYVNVFAWQRI